MTTKKNKLLNKVYQLGTFLLAGQTFCTCMKFNLIHSTAKNITDAKSLSSSHVYNTNVIEKERQRDSVRSVRVRDWGELDSVSRKVSVQL